MNEPSLWTARWTTKLLNFLFWIGLRGAWRGCRNLLRTSARKGATGTEQWIHTVRQLAAAAGDGLLGSAGSPGQLETSLNSGYTVGPCNSYLEGPTLFFWACCSRIALYLIARSARCDVRWVAAVFVGADGTEKRCSAISSCRSAARTSLNPPPSSSLGEERRLRSLLRRAAGARFPTLACFRTTARPDSADQANSPRSTRSSPDRVYTAQPPLASTSGVG